VKDESSKHNLRLLIEDYPYAVDGLEIWSAIESWVNDYCSIYYPNDSSIQIDIELRAWWKEIREIGHGDLKNEKWWPDMHTFQELTKTCTTIIWIASALHAAVNFGQYSYAGYLPNRPTISRQRMPEPGTKEYDELTTDPDKVFLKTITSQLQTILGISLIEILSRHSSDEVYLGQRDTKEWTSDQRALSAFEQFKIRLEGIEKKILEMNNNNKLKNRNGPVEIPYMLLYPNTSNERHEDKDSLAKRGIPNSVSI
jgi:linoleate 9S-lipoxygenase